MIPTVHFIKVRPDGDSYPVGTIILGARSTETAIWHEVDGRVLRQADYPDLHAVIGTSYTHRPEGRFKAFLRRLFRLPGPNDAYMPGEFRLPRMQ